MNQCFPDAELIDCAWPSRSRPCAFPFACCELYGYALVGGRCNWGLSLALACFSWKIEVFRFSNAFMTSQFSHYECGTLWCVSYEWVSHSVGRDSWTVIIQIIVECVFPACYMIRSACIMYITMFVVRFSRYSVCVWDRIVLHYQWKELMDPWSPLFQKKI